MMRRLTCGAAVAASVLAPTLSMAVGAQTPPEYHVSKTVSLGAPDRWDYVLFDAPSHRVFVAHGDRVTVVDGHTGAILGEVTGFPGGTHGIAIVNSVGRGYTDDGQNGEAGSFDLKTLQVQKRTKAAEDADAIAYDPVSGHVFVINGDGGTITVIDAKTDTAVATIQVGGKLEFAVSGQNGKLYVNGAEKQEVVRIDTRTNAVDARWPVPACTSPHGLAIDTSSHRLFVSCLNNLLMVVDMDTGATVSSLPIGSGTDAAAFDPKRHLIFSSNGRDGTLSVIQEKDPRTFVSLATIKTAVTARTMSLDPETERLYLVAADIDPNVAPDAHHRPALAPGSLKLLFLDPGH